MLAKDNRQKHERNGQLETGFVFRQLLYKMGKKRKRKKKSNWLAGCRVVFIEHQRKRI